MRGVAEIPPGNTSHVIVKHCLDLDTFATSVIVLYGMYIWEVHVGVISAAPCIRLNIINRESILIFFYG